MEEDAENTSECWNEKFSALVGRQYEILKLKQSILQLKLKLLRLGLLDREKVKYIQIGESLEKNLEAITRT